MKFLSSDVAFHLYEPAIWPYMELFRLLLLLLAYVGQTADMGM